MRRPARALQAARPGGGSLPKAQTPAARHRRRPRRPPLRKLRDPNIKFLGWQTGEVVHEHYRHARALLFPGEEDFGIVPVEAMAHGCPVIAYGVGGATESVVDGQTGVWFDQQTIDCLASAIERAEAITFDPIAMHAHTQRFSHARFLREMRDVLQSALEKNRTPMTS